MKLTLSHKYNKNTSTCGRILTEYLLNAGRRPQTAEKARKSSHNQVEKKKKVRKELGWDLHPWEGALKEERFLHPGKSPHQWGVGRDRGEFQHLRGGCSSWFASARAEG